MNRKHALAGALVADAASMGLHWLYDQEQIQTVAKSGDVLFRQPEIAVYKDKRGAFAHSVKQSGELSHYGESARVVGQLSAQGQYSPEAHRQQFFKTFGPCGQYSGYADHPTKALIARMITEGDKIPDASGIDDKQMPAVCVVSGLFSAKQSVETTRTAAQVISTNQSAVESAVAVHQCLNAIENGSSLTEALDASARLVSGSVGNLMLDALAIKSYQPLETASRFGLACYIEHAMPVVWYLLKHATDFESAIRDNILCGGDSCGRSMALGAIAGFVFGVPEHLVERMENNRIPINY